MSSMTWVRARSRHALLCLDRVMPSRSLAPGATASRACGAMIDFDRQVAADHQRALPRVPQPGQAQRRPVARDLRRRAGRRTQRAGDQARQQRRQHADPSAHRRGRAADAEGQGSADAAEIALVRQWIDQGARATPTSAPAPQPWEAPLALTPPAVPAARSGPVGRRRSIGSSPRTSRPHGSRIRRWFPMRSSPGAYTSTSGDCCRRPTSCSAFLDDPRPDKRAGAGRDAARRRSEVRRALDVVLERSAAQRGRRHLLFRDRGPQEHHRLAVRLAKNNLPYDRVRHEAAQSDGCRRSGRVPCRRELARRDERRGDAVDAGVAEHRAGVSRHQPEMQRVPRQLREQVEAEGRVCAGGVFLRRSRSCRCTAATWR